MKRNFIHISTGLALTLLILACNFTSSTSPTEAPTSEPALPSPSAEPGPPPTEIAPTPQHQMIPVNLPPERSSQAGDQDSSQTADEKRAPGGDRFTFGRFERPFNATSMDRYFPYLDIQNTIFYQDETWIYAAITLKSGDENNTLAGRYGFEIDPDLDGRGQWLILAANPQGTEWTTTGVQVWFDANNDVGGKITVGADEAGNGDGYESLLVDNGEGNDPDLGWARISPQDPKTVELAVKRSLLNGDTTYMAGAWAGSESLNPALFDFNDHFTHAQAGTALIELENFYPIKALAELDNSCRVAIGFQPSGAEPGLCVTKPPEEMACPSNQYVCYNFGQQQVCICAP